MWCHMDEAKHLKCHLYWYWSKHVQNITRKCTLSLLCRGLYDYVPPGASWTGLHYVERERELIRSSWDTAQPVGTRILRRISTASKQCNATQHISHCYRTTIVDPVPPVCFTNWTGSGQSLTDPLSGPESDRGTLGWTGALLFQIIKA